MKTHCRQNMCLVSLTVTWQRLEVLRSHFLTTQFWYFHRWLGITIGRRCQLHNIMFDFRLAHIELIKIHVFIVKSNIRLKLQKEVNILVAIFSKKMIFSMRYTSFSWYEGAISTARLRKINEFQRQTVCPKTIISISKHFIGKITNSSWLHWDLLNVRTFPCTIYLQDIKSWRLLSFIAHK